MLVFKGIQGKGGRQIREKPIYKDSFLCPNYPDKGARKAHKDIGCPLFHRTRA
jgi:hypothetical protein